ncbi:MAG: HlyC/CorC family transporter [Gammaproteobacteria bacterium]
MEQISIFSLLVALIILIIVSGFFSASETAMMAINRYRLRHLVRAKNRTAILVNKLLEWPDKLLGVILIGNTFCTILASAVATIIAERLYGPVGVAIGAAVLTFIILIFAEMGPKTLAATLSQRIAFMSAWPLEVLLKILYPIVWIGNFIVNNILRLFRIKVRKHAVEQLTSEEFSTLLEEAGENIPDTHQDMLLAILGLEKITVSDILIPRSDIVGIDLEDEWDSILKQLSISSHNRLPVYDEDINNIKGILNVRMALNLVAENKLTKETLLSACEEVYFVPEGAKLTTQLIHFRTNKRRVGVVVDEYGDVLGLITLADMLEEIVGEFTTNITTTYKGIQRQPDGSYLISGSMNIRDLNRLMDWDFDIAGPKTLNGLILEYLEMIPQPGICLRLSGYPIEIMKVAENSVTIAKVFPK